MTAQSDTPQFPASGGKSGALDAENRLAIGEERLRLAIEAADLGLWDVDVVHGRLFWPPRVKAMFGIAADTPVSMADFYAGLHPDDRAATSEAYAAACDPARRALYDVEYRTVGREDGLLRWVAAKGRGIFDAEGRCVRVVGVALDITARKVADAALAESEARFRLMADATPQIMWITDAEGRTEFFNKQWFDYTGNPSMPASAAEVAARAVHPDDTANTIEKFEAARASGMVFETEHRIRSASGDYRWFLVRGEPLRDPATGAIARWFGSSVDIHDRKIAEEGLRQSEARYRTLFEAIDAGFCIVELKFDDSGRPIDYRLAEINPAFERQTGLHGGAGQWVSQAVPGLERHWFETYGRVALTGEPARFENYAEPFGRFYDVHAFRTGAPEEHRVAILFNDISDRRRAELDLREFTATLETQVAERTAEIKLFRDIVESHPTPICAFDTELRLTVFNQAHSDEFFRIFGHRVRPGEVFPDLLPPDQAPLVRGFMERALAGEVFTITGEFGDPDLSKPHWETRYAPLRDEAGQIVGAFHHAQNITDRLRAEAELRGAQDALRQAQKMEAVGQLTGGIAHDFNNMLAVIIGGLSMLKRKLSRGDTDVDRYVDGAMEGAARAASLTQRLLAFSRQQPLAPEPVDVNGMIAGMTELLTRSLGEMVEVETQLAPDLWNTRIDRGQLENAILNLALNARDAMPDGGTLTIATANLEPQDAAALSLPPVRQVMIEVIDVGLGMSAEVKSRAFDPFFTTKGPGKGTGLGLSQVFGFIRQSGGHVRIESEPGKGTVVSVFLPRFEGALPPVLAPADAAGARGGQADEIVMVVEDEERVRSLSVDALNELGYTVVEAQSATEALNMIENGRPVSLLFTDIVMPDMTGTELATHARQARQDLKVLFATGYARDGAGAPPVAELAHDLGADILMKPFSVEQLARKVRAALDGAGRGSGDAG